MFNDILKGEDNLQFNGQAPFFGFGDVFPTTVHGNWSERTSGSICFCRDSGLVSL